MDANPSLLSRLTALLDPSTPIIVQHALVGLLRNLAIPVANKRKLGDAGVIPRLVAMEPWSEQRDMLGSIEGGAVGIVKQLVRDGECGGAAEQSEAPEARAGVVGSEARDERDEREGGDSGRRRSG